MIHKHIIFEQIIQIVVKYHSLESAEVFKHLLNMHCNQKKTIQCLLYVWQEDYASTKILIVTLMCNVDMF